MIIDSLDLISGSGEPLAQLFDLGRDRDPDQDYCSNVISAYTSKGLYIF